MIYLLVSTYESNGETRYLVDYQACLLNWKFAQMNGVEEKNKHELVRCIIKHPDGDGSSLILSLVMKKRGRASELILLPSIGLSPTKGPSSFLRLSTQIASLPESPQPVESVVICGNNRLETHKLC